METLILALFMLVGANASVAPVVEVEEDVYSYDAWREYKRELTGREWDYDFRRLFYTWTEDITGGEFHEWVEIASRDQTAGWIMPLDLWVDARGDVHLLWTERAIDTRLRERFFPGERQSHALNYAVLRQGAVALRRTLAIAEEGVSEEIPQFGRFQVTPEERLFVCFFVRGRDAAGARVAENRVLEIRDGGEVGEAVRLPLEHPMSSFFTATTRGGSPPSHTLEMLGTRADGARTISYARVRLW